MNPTGRTLRRFPTIMREMFLGPTLDDEMARTPPFVESRTDETGVEYGLPVPMTVPPTNPPSQSKKTALLVADMLRAGADAASTPNVAYGGPTDIFRGMSNAGQMARQRELQDYSVARQKAADMFARSKDQREWKRINDIDARNAQLAQDASRRADIQAQKEIEDQIQAAIAKGAEIVADPNQLDEEKRARVRAVNVGGKTAYLYYPTEEEVQVKAWSRKNQEAQRAGLKEGTDAWTSFMLTGKLPAEKAPRRLVSKEFPDDVAGTTTVRWYDAETGDLVREDKPVQTRKRPPQGPSSEPGVWTPEFDQMGTIVGYRNNKTLEFRVPNDGVGNRKNALPAGERKEKSAAEVAIQNLNELEQLANNTKGSIGPFMGRVTAVEKDFTGTSTAEENRLFQLSGMIADDLLRMKSGAQINESEMARLMKLVPDPRQPYKTFMDNLSQLRTEVDRLQQARGGAVQVAAPPQARTQQQNPQQNQQQRITIKSKATGRLFTVAPDKLAEKLKNGYELAQ